MRNQPPHLLQLCPNRAPPFADICNLYESAARTLGATVETWFLQAGEHTDAAQSLIQTGTGAGAGTRAMARALRSKLGAAPTLTLCHRYRSYKVMRVSRLASAHKIVVAHEYELFKRWQRRLEYRCFGRGFRFAGVSEAVSAELAQTTGQALTLPNGLDADAFRAALLDRCDARQLLGLSANDTAFTVGVVGRLHHKKRPHLALDICSDWPTPLHLVYVGAGDLEPSLTKDAERRNVDVTFSGFVPDAKRSFAAFDALLVTSSAAEAFGMVALEALAAGLPVVAPKVPGPASVLGELGCYYDDADDAKTTAARARDALREAQALCVPERIEAWRSAAAQRVAQRFSIDAIAERISPYLNNQGASS